MPQRRDEPAAVMALHDAFWPLGAAGPVEGGDIRLIRPGLAAIGSSGGRTDHRAGAAQFALWLEAEGWEVALAPFDEPCLRLDVIFSIARAGASGRGP